MKTIKDLVQSFMDKNKKTGLALGGGAVLGAAHIGVLKALEEQDLKIDYITGTSIGAFVAAFAAFGKKWEEIEAVALELDWIDITRLSLSKYGLLSNDKLGALILEHIGEKNIEDSKIPLALIATDVTNGKKVILDKGPLDKAVMASTCIPGIFQPVEIDGAMLVDGGITENIPIKTVRDMGAEFVIGVDLNAKSAYKKPEHILDVILNSFHFVMQHAAKLQTADADLLIKPDMSAFSMSDTSQVVEMIQQGYEDAKESFKLNV